MPRILRLRRVRDVFGTVAFVIKGFADAWKIRAIFVIRLAEWPIRCSVTLALEARTFIGRPQTQSSVYS